MNEAASSFFLGGVIECSSRMKANFQVRFLEAWRPAMASGYSAKRFEQNRGNCKLCHLNPFEFLDHTGCSGCGAGAAADGAVFLHVRVFEPEEIFRKAVIGRRGRKGRKTPDVHFTATRARYAGSWLPISTIDYYHRSRTHLSLGKDSPETRPVQPPEIGSVVAVRQAGGLQHRYERRAA